MFTNISQFLIRIKKATYRLRSAWAGAFAVLSVPIAQPPLLLHTSISKFCSLNISFPTLCNYALLIFTILVVRLVGGSSNAGRVEVYYNGIWGTVCDDYWDIRDARVVCRQLGFRYALNAYRNARYGQGTGQILLENVNCVGYESSIFSCRHRKVRRHYCSHSKDASVRCGNTGGENNR